MKAFVILFLSGSGFIAAASADDVIHLKNGDTITTEIDALTDNIVTFSQKSAVGSASRTGLRMSRLPSRPRAQR